MNDFHVIVRDPRTGDEAIGVIIQGESLAGATIELVTLVAKGCHKEPDAE